MVTTIIAINKVEEALISKITDYCVVGDLMKLLPSVVDESKSRRS